MDYRPRQPAEGDLTGLWRAKPISLSLKRTGADADLDDQDWQLVEVPGHWQQVPDLADQHGPILYRYRFAHRPPEDDERLWLRFDGVLSGAEIWLDGSYIGDTTSYFATHRFDVTEHLADRTDHLLAVEVSSPDQGHSGNKTSLTGALQAGHLAPPGNPGGIWRPAHIDSTGPVAIRYSRLLCTGANSDEASLQIRLVLDAAEQVDIKIDTSVVGPAGNAAGGGGEQHRLASGENRIEWTVPIAEPRLWWPHVLGGQPMYEVAVAVRMADGRLTDRRDWRTGLRKVTVDDFVWTVNGRRLFVKGIAAGPADRFLNSTPTSTLREDVQAVRDAGLDMIRVYGHIARPELYEEADRLGVLVWQDLPMVGGYSSKIRSAAKAMARVAVDHLGHHPSVGLWCAHSEPRGPLMSAPPTDGPGNGASASGAGVSPSGPAGQQDSADQDPGQDRSASATIARRLSRHLLPSWNRSVLDPVMARELRNADRSRPILAHSAVLPGPGDPGRSDSHLWLGWHVARAGDLPALLKRWPRLGAFLGGIGSQSVANDDWDESAPEFHGAEQGAFARYLPRRAYGDGRSWAMATRAYQGDILRQHIETLRRLKYNPAGGFCIMALADVVPEGGFGVLDSARRPKPAHDVLIDACRPVVVIADVPPSLAVPGETISLPVHVVSDLRKSLGSVRVTGHAHAEGGPEWSVTAAWEGEVPADGCVKVGDFQFEAPPDHGPIQIDLELESSEAMATNRYRTVVIPFSEALDHHNR